jgi:DNA-binding MarR family transcriptional regulator
MTTRSSAPDKPGWTFLSNHGHVLLCLAQDPDSRLRDVADRVGVTERTVFAIIADMVEAGVVEQTKVGRRNRYHVHRGTQLRHPIESAHTVGELIDSLGG